MRSLRILSVIALISFAAPVQAWFFQPPPRTVSEETLARFQEASTAALAGLASFQEMLLLIEADEANVNEVEATTIAINNLFTAANLFAELPTEDLENLGVPVETIARIDERAVRLVVEAAGIKTAADLARYSSEQCFTIANLLMSLRERGFGPSSAFDAESRATVNQLVSNVANMLIVVSSVSGALALEYAN